LADLSAEQRRVQRRAMISAAHGFDGDESAHSKDGHTKP
jgi:hypothetical protein